MSGMYIQRYITNKYSIRDFEVCVRDTEYPRRERAMSSERRYDDLTNQK